MYLYGEMHGLIPLFTSWAGVGVAEIPVRHRCRQHGGLHCGKDQEPALSRLSPTIRKAEYSEHRH